MDIVDRDLEKAERDADSQFSPEPKNEIDDREQNDRSRSSSPGPKDYAAIRRKERDPAIEAALSDTKRDAGPQFSPVPKNETDDQLQHVRSASSSSSSSSPGFVARESIRDGRRSSRISRIDTERDLDRHPTALSRIETQRSQHNGTVGKKLSSVEPKKPLPNFGGGKDYPPPLPDREEYVVEFDGHDDPLHPQNWSMPKK